MDSLAQNVEALRLSVGDIVEWHSEHPGAIVGGVVERLYVGAAYPMSACQGWLAVVRTDWSRQYLGWPEVVELPLWNQRLRKVGR